MSRYRLAWLSLGCPEYWPTAETALLTYKDTPSLLEELIITEPGARKRINGCQKYS